MMEETLLVLKPDAVLRRFAGVEALKVLLSRGFSVLAFREMLVSKKLAEKHYAVHEGKSFYSWLIKFITSGPVVAIRVEGEDVIQETRKILGSTFAHNAEPTSLRGKYGLYGGINVAHASDSQQTALEEIGLWEREAKLTRSPAESVAKQMGSYIKFYVSKKTLDHTQELRAICIGIAEDRINEKTGKEKISKLLSEEILKGDRKYLKGFSAAVVETCLMDRMKKE
nr:nucleoside-diphosphate kinase [Candidatus Njordarchaeota archaeon]